MDIKVRIGDISKTKADTILYGIFEGMKKLSDDLALVDKSLNSELLKLINRGEIKGKLGEVTVIHSLGKLPAGQVAVLGLGKSKELTQDKIRIAIAHACWALREKGAKHVDVMLMGIGVNRITPQISAQAIVEGAVLGLYTFNRHISKKPEHGKIEGLAIIDRNSNNKTAIQQGITTGKILAEATNLARDMVNEPANYMTPTIMAEQARGVAEKHGLEIEVLEQEQMKELGMGAMLGVAQGSMQPPKFIVSEVPW